MSEKKVQWHPGFVAALDLELRDYREFLQFEKEYNLNTKPLEIDLLVIKKNAGIQIDNEIGRIIPVFSGTRRVYVIQSVSGGLLCKRERAVSDEDHCYWGT